MPNTRSVAVIGLGTFGSAVARQLARFGDHVLGVDADEGAVARHADVLSRAVIADVREARAMEEAGLGSYDVAVIAMATDVEANLMGVMNARAAGVPQVWAKSASDTHAQILERIGVDRVLKPETSYGELLAQALHNPLMRGSVRLAGEMHFAQVEVPRRLCGAPLSRAKLERRHDLRCLGVMRGEVPLPPDPGEELVPGDTLLLVGTRAAMRAFADRG